MEEFPIQEMRSFLEENKISCTYDYRLDLYIFKQIATSEYGEIGQALEYCFGRDRMKSIVLSSELIEKATAEELIDFLTASL